MNSWLKILIIISISVMTTSTYAGKVYKWIDENGMTQYTDSAPANKTYNTIKIHDNNQTTNTLTKTLLKQSNSMTEEQQLNEQAQQLERDQQAIAKKENCTHAKSNLKAMQESSRIKVVGDDGEFRYLNDQERQEQTNKAKTIISENCASETTKK